MPTIDRRPTPLRTPIEVAGDCARRGETEAAKTIISLVKALHAQGILIVELSRDLCTCPILDGIKVTGSSCPVHGLSDYKLD